MSDAISAAAAVGSLEAIRTLLAEGARLGAASPSEGSVLMKVLEHGHWDCARELLSTDCDGCEVNHRESRSGLTALLIAMRKPECPAALIGQLVACGSDRAVRGEDGRSVVDLALADASDDRALTALQALPRELVHAKLSDGRLPLDVALNRPTKAAAAALIRSGADPGARCTSLAKTALHDGHDDLLAALVSVAKQSTLDALDIDYRRMVKAGLPRSAAAVASRECGADVAKLGSLLLLECATTDSSDALVHALLDAGADLRASGADGNTALHLAAKCGNAGVAKALCERGCNLAARNKHNRTPKMMPKLASDIKSLLCEMEEALQAGKLQTENMWRAKLQATQTDSALGVRAL